jgi:uncharacterized membrane protein
MRFLPVIDPFVLVLMFMLMLAGSAVLWWRLRRRRGRSALLFALRVGGLVLFSALLLGVTQEDRGVAAIELPQVIMSLDRSASMGHVDVEGISRLQTAIECAQQVQQELEGEARVILQSFAETSESLDLTAERSLQADGKKTEFSVAANGIVAAASQTAPTVGVILSDGIDTSGQQPERVGRLLKSRGVLLNTVCLGGEVLPVDMAVEAVRSKSVGFVGQELAIPLRVRSSGLGAREVTVRLLGENGREIAAKKVHIKDGGETVVKFKVKHKKAGFKRYTAKITPLAAEFNRSNNQAVLNLTVLAEKIRVLFLDGAPHWDAKFFAQFALNDPHIQLRSISSFSRERCFVVDAAGGTREQLTRDELPSVLEDFVGYDIVVLGKGIDNLLTSESALALQAYVRGGGGLFFLRGRSYNGLFPELAALEPVIWDERVYRDFQLVPTAYGVAASAFSFGLDEPVAVTLQELPELEVAQGIKKSRSFVDIHAGFSGDADAMVPTLLTRRFGKGVVMLWNAEGAWHWGFPPLTKKKYLMAYAQFFGCLVRWLATQTEFLPGQDFHFTSSKGVYAPHEVIGFSVSSRLADAELREYRPVITISRRSESGGAQEVCRLQPGRLVAGREWGAILAAQPSGHYVATLHDPARKSKDLRVSFGVLPSVTEGTDRSARPEMLDRLAQATGGRRMELKSLIKEIKIDLARLTKRQQRSRISYRPAWDRSWVLLLITVVWFGLWIVRRRSGLS